MAGFLNKLLSMGEGKQMKRYEEVVTHINAAEPRYVDLSDAELAAVTGELRTKLANGAPRESILIEAFAAAREAGKRALNMRHFDVQLIGGMALDDGQIAEMKTGEGKTLVATLASYLNALEGRSVHIVTVNDYLAKRDSEWMGRLYHALGLEVGLIQNGMPTQMKKRSYAADITYGTNTEFGFDYLRDNMVVSAADRVQRGHHFAIVDEVDSILIDEARTPLIISGAGQKAADVYRKFASVMPQLEEGVDFDMDEAKRTITTTEVGLEKVEALLGIDDIYGDVSGQLANHLQQALKAQFLFHRDIDYVVVGGEVKIVDEFTGRIMEGRRWSEGLHQAVEAKERVTVREENQTLATITLQNYFRLYDKLSGMTGTAMTEDAEFREIYKLPVVAIPPNKPVMRVDENDLVYRTIDAKFNAVADEIARRNAEGQPCLIGTVSIESSERLSRLLDKRGIAHETLNAKHHEREAHIIAQAGRVGAVTIATNMAGRGTDILLGGNPDELMNDVLRQNGLDPALEEGAEVEPGGLMPPTAQQRQAAYETAKAVCAREHEQVVAAGGLCVIGTERHESRRIDNQLRGRSGRQGDPGVTQFYLSLEDDLMRLFGGDRMDGIARMMERTDIPEDMPLQASMVSKAIESAQRQVETMHFAARKNVLEYDDVMNLQRAAIYEERNAILDGKKMGERIPGIIEDAASSNVFANCPEKQPSDMWNMRAVDTWVANMTGRTGFEVEKLDHDEDAGYVVDCVVDELQDAYDDKRALLGDAVMDLLESRVMLRMLDTRWMAHLQDMDYLKTGIGLRAYGQRDPLVEYKNEAYAAFKNLTAGLYEDYLQMVLRIQVNVQEMPEQQSETPRNVSYSSPEATLESGGMVQEAKGQRRGATPQAVAQAVESQTKEPPKAAVSKPQTYVKDKDDPFANVGRNDPCPCGSGLKYKKCHGR